ncbi:MAG: ribose-phosphate diphosphokinase, partial [Propionibacteriaceae bacterium]|nr:ribose-phosphate diphosphokinase [Propionibacteriaceae bacterium]
DEWSDRLKVPLAIIHKRHDPRKANQVQVNEVVGEVEGRTCLIVDDMVDTAGTICQAAKALLKNGAQRVIVASTHPVLSDPAAERINATPFEEVIFTNTLPCGPGLKIDKMTVLSIAPLIARAIREVFTNGSVTRLFDTDGSVSGSAS